MKRDYMYIIADGIEHNLFIQYIHTMKDGTKIKTKYYVNEDGLVYGTSYNRIVKPYMNNAGYLKHNLANNGQTMKAFVHRMVASTWLQDTYVPGLIVNHIDGNKLNNSVHNLEWVTSSENTRHAVRIGNIKTKYSDAQIMKVIDDVNNAKPGTTVDDIARNNGVDKEYVYTILSKKTRTDLLANVTINKERVVEARSPYVRHKKPVSVTNSIIRQICTLRRKGKSVRYIMSVTNVSDVTVYNVLKKYGNKYEIIK